MSRWGNAWSEGEIDAYLRDFKSKDRHSDQHADVEPNPCHAAKKADGDQAAHPRFHCVVTYRTRRLADPTGRCCKWAIDGLVQGGLLGDDSLAWIEEITERQEKAATDETIIELYELVEK